MTVSEQIIQVLDALCEKFGIAIDWTNANVIPYIGTLCTKLVAWEIWSSIAWIGIMVALGIAFAIAAKMLYPTFKRGWEENARSCCDMDWQVLGVLAILFLVGFYFATVIVIGNQVMDIVKCATFPEMHVFEYIQGLINSAK